MENLTHEDEQAHHLCNDNDNNSAGIRTATCISRTRLCQFAKEFHKLLDTFIIEHFFKNLKIYLNYFSSWLSTFNSDTTYQESWGNNYIRRIRVPSSPRFLSFKEDEKKLEVTQHGEHCRFTVYEHDKDATTNDNNRHANLRTPYSD
jgi:hypothetical protein